MATAGLAAMALLAGAAPAAEDAVPVTGNDRPAAAAPESREASEALIDRLIAEYRDPPAPAAPTAAEQARIDKVLAGFAAESYEAREAASTAAVQLGTVALTAMRKAAAGRDLEVASRAEKAIEGIERARREGLVRRIEAVSGSAEILDAKARECHGAWARLAMDLPAAERDGKNAEAEKLRAEMARLDALGAALKAIREKSAEPRPGASGAAGMTSTVVLE